MTSAQMDSSCIIYSLSSSSQHATYQTNATVPTVTTAGNNYIFTVKCPKINYYLIINLHRKIFGKNEFVLKHGITFHMVSRSHTTQQSLLFSFLFHYSFSLFYVKTNLISFWKHVKHFIYWMTENKQPKNLLHRTHTAVHRQQVLHAKQTDIIQFSLLHLQVKQWKLYYMYISLFCLQNLLPANSCVCSMKKILQLFIFSHSVNKVFNMLSKTD